jgi:hypothetical protein
MSSKSGSYLLMMLLLLFALCTGHKYGARRISERDVLLHSSAQNSRRCYVAAASIRQAAQELAAGNGSDMKRESGNDLQIQGVGVPL